MSQGGASLKTTLILTSNSGWKYEKNTIPNLTESPKRIQCPSHIFQRNLSFISIWVCSRYISICLFFDSEFPRKVKTFNSAKLKRRKNVYFACSSNSSSFLFINGQFDLKSAYCSQFHLLFSIYKYQTISKK